MIQLKENALQVDRRTDGRTDGRMEGPTDPISYDPYGYRWGSKKHMHFPHELT